MGLNASLDVHSADDAVTVRLTVTNDGADPVELTFTSGQTAEFVVTADDTAVWRWSEGQLFTQQIRTLTLDPGESLSAEGTWREPQAGEYTVEASLVAAEQQPTATAPLTV